MAGETGFDVLARAAPAAAMQQQAIREQQRVQQQNTTGAQLLNAINNASNIKNPTDPQTIADETGKMIPNPTYVSKKQAYDEAQGKIDDMTRQYMQLNSPEQHATFAQHLHGLIFGHPTTQTQQPALSPNSSPVAPPAPPSGAPAGAAAPTPAAPVHPFSTAPNPVLSKIQEGIQGLGNHLKAAANPLPPNPNPVNPADIAKYYRDPGEVAAERQQALWGVRGQTAENVAEIRGKYMAQGRPPRYLSQETLPDLIRERQVDPELEIYGPDGRIITDAQLAEMPQGMIARKFQKGPNMFVSLGDQNSKFITVGNERIQVPSIGETTSENSTPLGVANTGATTTHQVPGMNPGEVVTLTGTRTPNTTGMAPSATTPTGAPVTNPTTPANPVLLRRPDGLANPVPATAQPVNPGARPPGAIPSGGAVKSKAQSSVAPPPAFAPGTMLSQGRSAQPVVSAMSVMAANVFGGNGEAPLWENAKMYDKPEIRTALNRALTLNALATPGTEDNPSFLQTLATGIGATGWSQEQINNANVEARQELERVGGPEALKMFAREAALQEDLSALRTATKASAAQGSIRTLVRAAPVYNVSSSQDFRNQLGATLNTAAASLRGYPAINPEYVKWWDRGVSSAKGGPTSSNAPRSTNSLPAPMGELIP